MSLYDRYRRLLARHSLFRYDILFKNVDTIFFPTDNVFLLLFKVFSRRSFLMHYIITQNENQRKPNMFCKKYFVLLWDCMQSARLARNQKPDFIPR